MDEPLAPATSDTAPGLERLRIWIGLIKFITGTVVLGVVSLYLNHQFQQSQLDLERQKSNHAIDLQSRQAEFDYLEKFMKEAMHEDLNVRIRLANYMKSAALSENVKAIWGGYHAALIEQRDDVQKRRDSLADEEQSKGAELAKLQPDERDARERLTRELVEIREEIFYLQDQLDRRRYGSFENQSTNLSELLIDARRARDRGEYARQVELLLRADALAPPSISGALMLELSSAYRSLRQFGKAVWYAQKALERQPQNASARIGLAIMQKNAGDLDGALDTLETAERLSKPDERPNVVMIRAGYLHHAGRRDEGARLFETIRSQVESDDAFATNLAWYFAVAGPEERFYAALEHALKVNAEATRRWMNIEIDLDRYRADSRFKAFMARP